MSGRKSGHILVGQDTGPSTKYEIYDSYYGENWRNWTFFVLKYSSLDWCKGFYGSFYTSEIFRF